MPQGNKSAATEKPKRQAGSSEKGHGLQGAARPAAESRAWGNVNKLQGPGKQIVSGRKVPNGPVGGLGRKTNLSRSS